MTELAALNVKITGDSTDLKAAVTTATGDLARLGAAAKTTGGQVASLGPRMAQAASGGGGFAQSMRGVSQQLSQVGQQTMATGNFVQALAIQLPDLGLAFGAVGAAAGLLAGIALPLVIGAFTGTGESALTAQQSIDGLKEASTAYLEAAEAARATTAELSAEYGNLAAQAGLALQAIADVALVGVIQSTDAAIQSMSDSLLTLGANNMVAGSPIGVVLADSFGLASGQAHALKLGLVALTEARGLEAQARAAAELQRYLIAIYGNVEAMPGPLQQAYGQMANIVVEASKVAKGVKAANASVAEMPPVLAAAAGAASGLAGEIGGVADAAWGAVSAVGALLAAWNSVDTREQKERGKPVPQRPMNTRQSGGGVGGGSSGGGGASRDFAGELQAFQETLMTETELEAAQFAERQTLLQEFLSAKVVSLQEYQSYEQEIKAAHEAKMAEIEATAQQQRLAQTAGLFGALASIASAGGQRMAKAAAAFQAIEGTVNAYGAAIKALNTPGLTPAGRFAAYASVLAAGLKGVSAIRQAGGIGGGGAAGGVAQAGGAGQSQVPLDVRLTGINANDLFSGAQLGSLLDRLTATAGDRGYRLMVAA